MISVYSILLLVYFTNFNVEGYLVTFSTKLGDIAGTESRTVNGLKYNSFFGIRYGQEPVGPLFLQKPIPALPWNGTFVADQQVKCLQVLSIPSGKTIVGQEDCLVVNVHTTNVKKEKPLLPVMVFIHGGSFQGDSGSTEVYGPERLLDYEIILVTLNYRLGPLGFMSTSDDVIPGNMGLWDQNLALQWVQANIDDYGGDPNKVTLFGQSAGSMSVSFHLLSPQSKGLFHGAICQSGPATAIHLTSDHSPIFYARKLALSLGCKLEATTEELLECFKQANSSTIMERTSVFDVLPGLPLIFKPVVDNYTSDPFVPRDPWKIIESGEFNQVPLIMGANSDEGLFPTLKFYANETMILQMAENWDKFIAPLLIFNRLPDTLDQEVLELSKNVSNFIFPGIGIPRKENLLVGLVQLLGDINFNAIGSVTARKIAEKSSSSVYEYIYKHLGSFGLLEYSALSERDKAQKLLGQLSGINFNSPKYGVAHSDELFMLFKAHKIPVDTVFTTKDKMTSKNMLRLWTDFAKTGNPTPDPQPIGIMWENLSANNQNRLEIGSGSLEMKLDVKLEQRIEFWKNIWNK